MHGICRALHAFRRDERGSIAVEGMIMLPILTWVFLGTYVFFDAFRAQSTNVKAAYTIGDTLSRETGFVTPNYMNALFELQQFLTEADGNVDLRITVFRYDEDTDTYTVRWSQGRGGPVALTNTTLGPMRGSLPQMSDEDIAILTETWAAYSPAYEVGIAPFTFADRTVTRPRFAPQLCWNSVENGTQATAIC